MVEWEKEDNGEEFDSLKQPQGQDPDLEHALEDIPAAVPQPVEQGEADSGQVSLGDLLEGEFIIEEEGDNFRGDPLEVHSVAAEVPLEEEELQTEELMPVSVELTAADETNIIDEEYSGEELVEEEFAEEAAAGIPRLYWVGSIAATIICLVLFGAIYKKLNSDTPAEESVAKIAAPVVNVAKQPDIAPPAPVAEEAPEQIVNEELAEIFQQPGEQAAESVTHQYIATIGYAEPIGPEPLAEESNTEFILDNSVVLNNEPDPELPRPAIRPATPFEMKRGKAILQLHNGYMFSGKIMKITDEGYLVYMENGEIFLRKDDVAQILPAGSPDELDAYPDGYIDLNNGARMWGKIISNEIAFVTLGRPLTRVVLPKEAVAQVKLGPGYEIKE